MFRLASLRQLKEFGVVGMNSRNHDYIHRWNKRELYPRVDDKINTKLIANKRNIATPRMIGVVEYQRQISDLESLLGKQDQFVLKPSRGSGGNGILVITKRKGDVYYKPSGERLYFNDIRRHVNNILSGLYSLGGSPDKVLIEEVIQFTDVFEGYSIQGVPDVRVIVYRGYPVLAMTRLSTKASDGRANLHQGAIGLGIDLGTGNARYAVFKDRGITTHPDTGKKLTDLSIPNWREHLVLATRCYEPFELGYFGADIVLDKEKGPMVLELNARPGLAIQTANKVGLSKQLNKIDALDHEVITSVEERVDYSMKEMALAPLPSGASD